MKKNPVIALPPLPLGALAALAAAVLAACGGGDGGERNAKPGYLGEVRQQSYDGSSDDLLTAGLGRSGLAAATAPGFAHALRPTAAELRRLAIHTNYRAMLDMTAAGGYGTALRALAVLGLAMAAVLVSARLTHSFGWERPLQRDGEGERLRSRSD